MPGEAGCSAGRWFPGDPPEFWVLDDRLVIAEDWHAEIWLDDADSVATYLRVWHALHESAVHGADAQNVITRSRRPVGPR